MGPSGSKSFLQRWQSSRGFPAITAFVWSLLACSLAAAPIPTNKPASYPAWWFEREVIPQVPPPTGTPAWPANYKAADDFAAANLGQLKQVATAAYDELNAHLPGGAGTALDSLVKGWFQLDPSGNFLLNANGSRQPLVTAQTNDFAVVNLGQLKTVAKLFYDRLIAVHYTSAYPWANGSPDDFAVANLGQLKYLFSFDLTYSSLGDGVPDWWKLAAHLDPNDPADDSQLTANPNLTANGSRLTNLQAFLQSIDALATMDPQNPSTVVNPVQDLGMTTYAAIDVSSALTTADVTMVAINDQNNVAFAYSPSNLDGDVATAIYSQGSYSEPKAHSTANQTITLPVTFDNNDGSTSTLDIPFNVATAYTSLAADGRMGGVRTYTANGESFLRAIVSDSGNPTEYWPGGSSHLEGLGILSQGQSWAGLYYSDLMQLGNAGVFVGLFHGPSGTIGLTGTDGGRNWFYNTDPTPGAHNLMYNPSVYSPAGTSAGYLVDSNSGSTAASCTGTQPTPIGDVLPLAVSDGGLVLLDDPNPANPSNALCLRDNTNTNKLLSRLVPPKYHGRIRFPHTPAHTPWIDDQGDIIVDAELCDTTDPLHPKWVGAQLLWHNARAVASESAPSISFVQFPQNTALQRFNNSANFAGVSYEPASDHMAAALLLPVEVMVDANRDGQMSFTDPAIHDRDQTTADKPYRFWLNNDHDTAESDGSGSPDWQKDAIDQKRDLEDFTRLWISFKGITDLVKSQGMQLQLEWKPNDANADWQSMDGNPAIKLFKAVENDGGRKYVEEDAWAAQQLTSPYNATLGQAGKGTTLTLPLSQVTLTNLTETNPYLYLLFEGVTAGKGRLVLSLVKNGQKVGEYPPLYLDLRDIKNMYERWTVDPAANVPSSGADPLGAAVISTRALPAGQSAGFTYDAQSPEEKKYIVFAHGWNMAPAEKDMFAETAYKRLWWQGYKGRFAAFQWPTTYGFDPTADWFQLISNRESYDKGDFIAWRSAPALAGLLSQLNSQCSGQVYLMGHSMGNVVSGEALRLFGRSGGHINTYVACEAAVQAECYDPATTTTFPLDFGYLGGNFGPDTPDIFQNWLTPTSAGVGSKVSFYNLNDYALNVGVWEFDQISKPDNTGTGTHWGWHFLLGSGDDQFWRYTPPALTYTRIYLGTQADPKDQYEIMSYAAEPRSRALGRVSGNVAGFGGTHDMPGEGMWSYDPHNNSFKDREWHSGQFQFTNMVVRNFWSSLLDAFGLPSQP